MADYNLPNYYDKYREAKQALSQIATWAAFDAKNQSKPETRRIPPALVARDVLKVVDGVIG